MVTSFLYHCCDSIDGPLWLTEVRSLGLSLILDTHMALQRGSDPYCSYSHPAMIDYTRNERGACRASGTVWTTSARS